MVIILNVARRVVGMVVDGVSDVIALKAEQIRPAPEFGASLDTCYLQGLGTVDGRMLILVDIEKLIKGSERHLEGWRIYQIRSTTIIARQVHILK